MRTIDDGGPAFPIADPFIAMEPSNVAEAKRMQAGMSLRDYMAIHANDSDLGAYAEAIRSKQIQAGGIGILPDLWRATARYMHADAMLAARKGESE